jgi:hypothetical protein
MRVLLGYFLVAAVAGVSASAVIGIFFINFITGRFKPSDRAKRERVTNHRFECFSRHGTQARFSSVLIRPR